MAESGGMRWNGDPRRDEPTKAKVTGSGSTYYVDWHYADGTLARSIILNGTDYRALVEAIGRLPLERR